MLMIRSSNLFFNIMQNSFISYEVLHKLRIPQPIQFLQVSNCFHVDILTLELIEFICEIYLSSLVLCN